jgi:hypothetical protein
MRAGLKNRHRISSVAVFYFNKRLLHFLLMGALSLQRLGKEFEQREQREKKDE